MDPKVTLQHAAIALIAGDIDTAMDFWADYRHWRCDGGFEPVFRHASGKEISGDAFARHVRQECVRRLAKDR
jgi:hypothetical protein